MNIFLIYALVRLADDHTSIQVTEADIEQFEANYRGSDSEKKDLIDLYKKYEGKMNR